MTFEGVDDVHGSDCLPFGVLGVGDSIPDDVLEEYLEDAAGLFINESGNSLDTASSGKSPDGRLGDALDIVTQDLAMTFGASLSEALTALATSSHGALQLKKVCN